MWWRWRGVGRGQLQVRWEESILATICQRMVHHCSPSDRPQGEGATDTDDRKMFRIRSGNPVDGTEGSYAVRNNKSGRPIDTRVSICRIRLIEFIAVSDPLRPSAILELLNKLKIEITRYTEDVPNPDLFQSPQQEITDCLFHRFSLLSSRREALKHTRFRGSMLSSMYWSSPGRGRPLCVFLPLDLALNLLLQLGRHIGFENTPTAAVHTFLDLLPPLRIGTTQHNQAGCTWP